MTSDERTGVIYSFVNLKNNKRYIGRTLNPEHRYKTHLIRINQGKTTHSFYEEYRTNPKDFLFEIVHYNIPESLLPDYEKHYIKYYDCLYNGYNQTAGGETYNRKHYSKERNKKISESMKGVNNPNYGKHRVYEDNVNKKGKYHYE